MSRRSVAAARVAAAYPLAVCGLIVVTAIVPWERGPLALVPILAPHLLLSTLLLVPLAALARDPALRVALTLSLALGVLVLGDEWVSWPIRQPDVTPIALVSWNMQAGAWAPQEAIAALREQKADLIALQELTYEIAAAIETDVVLRSRYPYRILAPDETVLGLGVLSAYPITDEHLFQDPGSQMVRLDLGAERALVVLNVHPMPGRIGHLSFDGTRRNEELRRLRERIESPLKVPAEPFVVIGDLNVASSEPAYRAIAAGLRDVHRDVGQGPGWTWRPTRLASLGVGLLRIDYVLTSATLVPLSVGVDCSRLGDHCAVLATVGIP